MPVLSLCVYWIAVMTIIFLFWSRKASYLVWYYTLAMWMATTIGHIEPYPPDNELFSSYLEWVVQFFIANEIRNEREKATFLSLIWSQTYSLLRNLVSLSIPNDKSYTELAAARKKHYEPKPVIIAERFHFHRRSQAVGESINEYVAELRRLTTHCQFGGFLDEALRDRLVCGLRNEAIQKKLLTEADLTLIRAVELSVGMEAAEKNAKSLKGTDGKCCKSSVIRHVTCNFVSKIWWYKTHCICLQTKIANSGTEDDLSFSSNFVRLLNRC